MSSEVQTLVNRNIFMTTGITFFLFNLQYDIYANIRLSVLSKQHPESRGVSKDHRFLMVQGYTRTTEYMV